MNETISTVTFDPDMAEILHLVQQWHAEKIETLRLIVDASNDVAIQMRGPEGKRTELTGVARVSFQAGVSTAMNLFLTLPFTLSANSDLDVDGEEE